MFFINIHVFFIKKHKISAQRTMTQKKFLIFCQKNMLYCNTTSVSEAISSPTQNYTLRKKRVF